MAEVSNSDDQGHLWMRFAEDTSLHACGHTVKTSKSFIHRLWWALITFALVSGLIFTVTDHFIAVSKWPTRTQTRVEYLSSIEFPTVTFCNSNGLDKLKLNEIVNIEDLMAYSNPSLSHLANVSSVINDSLFMDMPQEYFYRNMSITKEDHIVQARFGFDTLGLANFEAVDGIIGRCFTFNSAGLISKHGATKATANGAGNSLMLLLNIHQEKYYAGPHSHADMMIYINHPSHKQTYLDPVILVPPGSISFVGLTVYKHKLLSPPFKSFGSEGCLDTESSGFINPLKYSTYSFGACLEECAAELIVDKCGCKPSYMPVPIYYNITYQRQLCNCLKPCTFYVYDTKLSHGVFPSLATAEYMVKTNFVESAEYARNNLLEVQIFFEQLILNTVEHEPEYPLTSIISTVGGAMGFCLGASIASLYEFLETGVRSVWLLMKKLVSKSTLQKSRVSGLK